MSRTNNPPFTKKGRLINARFWQKLITGSLGITEIKIEGVFEFLKINSVY